jgi:hypothetical protein
VDQRVLMGLSQWSGRSIRMSSSKFYRLAANECWNDYNYGAAVMQAGTGSIRCSLTVFGDNGCVPDIGAR